MDTATLILESTARVVQQASYVQIDNAAVKKLAIKLGNRLTNDAQRAEDENLVAWDSGDFHYNADAAEGGPLTCQYVLVMDALNFCFWSNESMEYEHLARGLKTALTNDPHALDAEKLLDVSTETLTSWFSGFCPPQVDERKRKLKEVGLVLKQQFSGLAYNIVMEANQSAQRLLQLVLMHFPGFRDHSIYKGEQIHFYKRAQIFIGDVWAAYGRPSSGIFGFHDIGTLTMFADYRIPQLLRPEGVLIYSKELSSLIDKQIEIPSGSEMEIEIRAATIQAVQTLHHCLTEAGHSVKVIELDWLLWQIGEHNRMSLLPHHRTLTVYY